MQAFEEIIELVAQNRLKEAEERYASKMGKSMEEASEAIESLKLAAKETRTNGRSNSKTGNK